MDVRIIPRRLQGVVTLVQGSFSQAAFWYAANFLGGEVDIRGLSAAAKSEERNMLALYRRLRQSGDAEIDLSDCPPDWLPALSVMAAARWGSTRFVHIGPMPKGCGIASIAYMLRDFGVGIQTGPAELAITGGIRLQGNLLVSHAPSDPLYAGGPVRKPSDVIIDGVDDDRAIMAAAIAASASAFPVKILESDTVCESYPDFFVHYQQLGGEVHII